MINVSLIGVSGYASLYLDNLRRLHFEGKICLVSALVHELHKHEREVALLKETNTAVFETATDFFEHGRGTIDLCCIPTGIPSHASLSIMALRTGSHVLVEKPAAASVEEIEAMQKVASELNRTVFVGYQNMYSEETWNIKEALLGGVIGEIDTLHCMGLWPRSLDYFKRNDWAGRVVKEGKWIFDSVLHNAFGHFLNLMCFWSGTSINSSCEVDEIEAHMYRVLPIESFDTCSVEIKTASSALIRMTVSHNSYENVDPIIRISGSKGSLEWTPEYYIINGQRYSLTQGVNESFNKARSAMFDNVVARLQGADAHICDLSIARVPTEIVNRMHKSFQITPVDEALVSSYENDMGYHKAIIGLEEAVKRSFEEGVLLDIAELEVS